MVLNTTPVAFCSWGIVLSQKEIEMKNLFTCLALGLIFLASQSSMAAGNDCSQAIRMADAYKGVVATISKVTAKRVASKDANGLRYDFKFTYPNGYVGNTWTVMPNDTKFKITNGDKMIWIPATREIREMNPSEDRRVPAIVDKSCNVFSIDFSMPSKNIAGI